MKKHEFPTLYKLDTTGNIRQWKIWVTQTKKDEPAHIYAEAGLVTTSKGEIGKKVETKPKIITSGKNIGKKNETTIWEQAIFEANSKWTKKQETEHFNTDINNIDKVIVKAMTAQEFGKHCKKIEFPAIVQRKYDGVRTLSYLLENDTIALMSRQGKFYKNLEHIRQEVNDLLDKYPYKTTLYFDGEMGSFGKKQTLSFQEAISIIRSEKLDDKKRKREKEIEYIIYDFVDTSNLKLTFKERNVILKNLFKKMKFDHIKLSPTATVKNIKEIDKKHTEYVEQGFEGIMIRNMNSPYEFKRSYNLQKYKFFTDSEFEIVDFKEATGNDIGTIVFICQTDKNDIFEVRPQGTREQRKEMFEKGKSYIGKMLTVKYQELTDDGKPRFPVGINIRDYE